MTFCQSEKHVVFGDVARDLIATRAMGCADDFVVVDDVLTVGQVCPFGPDYRRVRSVAAAELRRPGGIVRDVSGLAPVLVDGGSVVVWCSELLPEQLLACSVVGIAQWVDAAYDKIRIVQYDSDGTSWGRGSPEVRPPLSADEFDAWGRLWRAFVSSSPDYLNEMAGVSGHFGGLARLLLGRYPDSSSSLNVVDQWLLSEIAGSSSWPEAVCSILMGPEGSADLLDDATAAHRLRILSRRSLDGEPVIEVSGDTNSILTMTAQLTDAGLGLISRPTRPQMLLTVEDWVGGVSIGPSALWERRLDGRVYLRDPSATSRSSG